MPVVQFTVKIPIDLISAMCMPDNYEVQESDCRMSYYAKCKDYKSYVRNIKCIWNKEKKLLHESGDHQFNIYGIIGGVWGDVLIIEHEQREESYYTTDGEYKIDYYTDKKLQQRLIECDPNCININRLDFCKTNYNKQYRQQQKMTPKEKLRSIGFTC